MADEDETGVAERVPEVADRDGGGARSALKSKELLIPAAVSAASAIAAAKGPSLVRKLSGESESEAEKLGQRAAEGAKDSIRGGAGGGLAGKALSKVTGSGGGTKKTRRLPIQRWTDVAVPVDKAYDAWTKFDEFPRFMHRVLSVERKGNDRLSWQEKIWFSRRQWEGRITERRKNELIAWKTTSGMSSVDGDRDSGNRLELSAAGAEPERARRRRRPDPRQGPGHRRVCARRSHRDRAGDDRRTHRHRERRHVSPLRRAGESPRPEPDRAQWAPGATRGGR